MADFVIDVEHDDIDCIGEDFARFIRDEKLDQVAVVFGYDAHGGGGEVVVDLEYRGELVEQIVFELAVEADREEWFQQPFEKAVHEALREKGFDPDSEEYDDIVHRLTVLECPDDNELEQELAAMGERMEQEVIQTLREGAAEELGAELENRVGDAVYNFEASEWKQDYDRRHKEADNSAGFAFS